MKLLRKAYSVLFYHFVWTTQERLPLITEDLERPLHRCIESEVLRLGGKLIVLGGMPDHLHLVVHLPTKVAPSRLMQQVKGVSAQFSRGFLADEALFRWQHGYGVFSLSRSHIEKVVPYVQNQKRHHAEHKLWQEWEQTDVARE